MKKPRRCELCGAMKIKGKHLEFISIINRDGSGTKLIDCDMGNLDDDVFHLTCLSITQGTYIASEFNSYVVKLKHESK